MTDPTTPLTDESEALLAEVHGTQMALTVFPARLRAIEAAAARRAIEGPGGCPAAAHHRVRTFQKGGIVGTTEDGEDIVYAPDTLVADRCTACGLDFLATLPRPEEPRVERCAVCGVGRWVIAHDPEAGPSYHPFTPEAR